MLKRSFLKRKPIKRKKKEPLSEEEIEKIKKLHALYLSIRRKRGNRSEISGDPLGPFSALHYHHILPKNPYTEYILEEDNIIQITEIEHGNVENNKFRYEEINRRRELLKTKHNIND